ncbi:MAG: serine/threonine protein kinase [Deltaproteobacteria bacterium]|nr:serine/threonine protein kinase [Deltaproteobacteria bacterium]
MVDNISSWGENETKMFYDLTPDKILNAVESGGYRCTGRCFALNSMENRVYEIEILLEDASARPGAWDSFRVAKFYRPARWTKEQITEEHEFLLRLQDCDIPVVAPLPFADGSTLKEIPESKILYAIFPKVGGRCLAHDELDDQQLAQLGRLIARIHNVGAVTSATERILLSPATYIEANLNYLLNEHCLPPELEDTYEQTVSQLLAAIKPLYPQHNFIATHGDFHLGNILWGQNGPLVVDFDDMVRAPAIQDLWLLLNGRREENEQKLQLIINAYEQMRAFDQNTLNLIEPLRTMRLVHFSAWIARRWKDPAFSRAFPYFGTARYWQEQIADLREQLALLN